MSAASSAPVQRSSRSRVAPAPAFSMSTRPGMPSAASAWRSSSRASARVRTGRTVSAPIATAEQLAESVAGALDLIAVALAQPIERRPGDLDALLGHAGLLLVDHQLEHVFGDLTELLLVGG